MKAGITVRSNGQLLGFGDDNIAEPLDIERALDGPLDQHVAPVEFVAWRETSFARPSNRARG